MKKKLSIFLILAMVFALGLSGCGSGGGDAGSDESQQSAEAEVSKDTAVLVVSFGTSFNDSRDATIGAIEKAIGEAMPQYEVRRAFTSQIIIDKLKERDDLEIDNVTEALDRAAADGIKTLIVQPTHLMDGLEYNDLKDELDKYKDSFDQIALGEPLLTSDDDYDKVITAITDATKDKADDETAVVFMGHGTEADSNHVYADLQQKLTDQGFDNYYIGTVEAEPSVEDVQKSLKKAGKYKKVVLEPLMVVAGDHANNDMAGDEKDSWKSVLTKDGYEVECVLTGLGEREGIQDIYVAHAQAAADTLK